MNSLGSVAIIAVALLLTACGDGEDSRPPGGIRAVTHDDLAVMVLPQDKLGDLAGELQRGSSEYDSASSLAIDTFDPDDTAADFEAMGFIDGYALEFLDLSANPFSVDLPEVMSVATSVDQWRDEEAAQRFLEHMVDDVRRFDGRQVDDTAIDGFEEFTVDKLGDAAGGMHLRVGFAGTDVSFAGTVVYFQLGSLTAAVFLTGSGEADLSAELVRIAGALEARIEGVLDGSVELVPGEIGGSLEPPVSEELVEAATQGDTATVERLLGTGVHPDSVSDLNHRETALMAAAGAGHASVAQLLISRGAEIDARSAFGGTALMTAAGAGQADLAELLIASGADVNAHDEFGGTALFAAVASGEGGTVQMLIDAGAQVNQRFVGSDATPLIMAAVAGTTEVIPILLAAGADPNARSAKGLTAAEHAIEEGHDDIAALLRTYAD